MRVEQSFAHEENCSPRLARRADIASRPRADLPDKPYIYVEGKAEVEKPPDIVTLRFDLVARNPDQAKANQEVQTKANKVFTLLNDGKIARNDTVASDIKSEPQFENNEEYGRKRGKIIGYSVTRTFAAKVRDIQVFAQLVDELLAIPGVELSNIETGLSKEEDIRAEIFEKSLTNAREQAEKSLKPMDMKLDSIFAVSPVAFPQIRANIFGSDTDGATTERVIVTGSYIPTGGNRALPEYRLAPIAVRQHIHVIYLISPAK